MEPESDAPVTSLDKSKVSTPHTIEEEEHPFPPEGFPYTGSIPISVYQEFPPNYVSLVQLVSSTLSASSLYHNPVWASGAMLTPGPIIANPTSHQAVTSVLVQPTILKPLVSSVPVTHLDQLAVLKNVTVSSFIPPVSGQDVAPSGGKNLSVSMVSGTTNVTSS